MNKLTFSLLLVALCASAVLARTSPQIRRPFKFFPGQTYIYEYRGRQFNGLAKLADQYAGLTLDCDVILQALPEASGKEVLMKLDDIKIEQLHTQALDNNDVRKLNQGREVNQHQMSLYKEELSKPIRFTYLEGKVLRFVADPSDTEWSVNIKKSILSLFQLDLAPTKIIKSPAKQVNEAIYGYQSEDALRSSSTEMPLVYPIYEEHFGGICETLYELDSVDNVESRQQDDIVELSDVLNVTKTVNYRNCLTDPSVSYDRHSFNVNTQTIKGRLFAKQPTVATTNYYPVPEELKSKYSWVADHAKDNVASPVPVERTSYTKYNITTSPQAALVNGRSIILTNQPQQMPADMAIIEGIYSEGKIKYEADGDLLISDTQQSLKLVSCVPTSELARVAPEISSLVSVNVRQPSVEYQTIQCELSSQKVKFYQTLWKFAQMKQQQQMYGSSSPMNSIADSRQVLYSHQMVLPFALSASWYPLVANGDSSPEQSLERTLNPEELAKSFENVLVMLAENVLTEDVAQSKKAGELVVRLINIVAFLPRYKLTEIHERIIEHISQAKQQQIESRGKQALVDNDDVAKWKIVRKLYLDSLPLAGSKQAIEMIEYLIESQRVKTSEAKELCEAVPANLRYPDTEIIDAFIRISQLPQVRKSRSLFASCSIAVGKMIGSAYAKSKDASFKPTTYETYQKLPSQLRDDDLVKQVVDEADPRRSLPIDWNMPPNRQQQLYERLVLDEQDLIKYVKLYKQMLNKASSYHDKVIYIETLAHMRAPQVLPILEPFVSGRLSLAQCLGQQPLDINRPVEQSQWYNYYGRQQQQKTVEERAGNTNVYSKDWNDEASYGAEECNYMRTIAIYAMAHITRNAPNKVQTLLLPVFDNTYEPYQIRIAAFTVMMLTPVEENILERIASQMWREPSKEVASFVVGTIDTISKMTSPAMLPYKLAAQKAADSMPKQYLDTWKFSWFTGGDHFNHQKQNGFVWVAESIKSNVSSIPRAAYLHLGRYHGSTGKKFDNQLELGFTSKGLESLLKSYIAYNKQQPEQESNIIASIFETLYDAQDDIVKHYREARDSVKQSILEETNKPKTDSEPYAQNYFFRRQQPIDGVNWEAGKQSRQAKQMFESSNIRSKRSITFKARSSNDDDEEAKFTLFTKLFDSTSYHALDKKQIINLLEKADDYIKMVGDELIKGNKLHYVKMMMPSNMWHMVPSQLGLPIIVTHRKPIVASLTIDASHNGQLTSNKLSQILRQKVTGDSQIPNIQGQNFAIFEGLNVTALIKPKLMHSDFRFMFAVEQANNEAFGTQVEKSHQISLPMELSIAYSRPKQLVSIAIEPKTPTRMTWVKEAAKTFVAPLALGSAQPENWLGSEQLIRTPSSQAQYKRQQRREHFVPSILGTVQNILNEPKEQQLQAIEELETPYKFAHRFVQSILGLELFVEGVSDDEDVARTMSKPELSKPARQWTSTEDVDDLDQHSKSGPLSEYLHLFDSAINRPAKYLEFYASLMPEQKTTSSTGHQFAGNNKSPVYRMDFVLSGKPHQSVLSKLNQFNQSPITLGRRQQPVVLVN